MDEIKKERIKRDQKTTNFRAVSDEMLRYRYVQEGMDLIAHSSWPKYLLGAFAVTAVALLLNIRWVKVIHFNSYVTEKKNNAMKRFTDRLDKEEIIFQNNLLKKFRANKNVIIRNVTDDDLKNSKFFD